MSDPGPGAVPPAPWHKQHLWELQPVRDVLLVASIVGVLYLGYLCSSVTVPALVALGLAYLFEPLINWLTTHIKFLNRQRTVVLLLLAVLALISLLLIVAIPQIARQASQLKRNASRYIAAAKSLPVHPSVPLWARESVRAVTDMLPSVKSLQAASADDEEDLTALPLQPDKGPHTAPAPDHAAAPLTEQRVRALVREELAAAGRAPPATENAGVLSFASRGLTALNFVLNLVGGVASFIVFSVICAFCFYYFSVSFPAVKEFGSGFIPAAQRERTLELVGAMDRTISAFVRGRLTICFIMGLLYATGWTICGVPHAILLGLLVGACSLVPYLSAIGLPAAWALLAVSLAAEPSKTGVYFTPDGGIAWLWVLLLPAVVTVVVQVVEDYILNPIIQGKATNLHPVTIMLAVIAGGSLAGVYGMLLAIPFTACLKIYLSEILMPRVKQWLAGKRKDPIPV